MLFVARSLFPGAAPATVSTLYLCGSSWTAPASRLPSWADESACAGGLSQAPALSLDSRHSNSHQLPGERSQWLPKAAVLCGSASASGNGLFLRAIIAESCDFRNPAGRARQKKDLSGLQGCPRRSPGITKLLQTCPNSVRVPLVESPRGWDFQAVTNPPTDPKSTLWTSRLHHGPLLG
uniref:uncharacterized protein LOC118150973 isoform X2 n=1 Tax=Callithrix jacchus TaxID=9483 RepID=UPI0023DD0052|nr:uncharacterized protein LOC118150973 isoform X2 [Callithrix jacchus]